MNKLKGDYMKKFIKENLSYLIVIIVMVLIMEIELPYYIEAPGGTINLTQRIEKKYNKKHGSLNMLYVTEYKGNIVTVLLSKVIKSWDLYEISNQQVSNEDSHDIYVRNKVMLDNSIQNATFVAYNYANKKLDIKDKENIVIATVKDNGIKIGDVILKIDDTEVEDINTIKEYLNTLEPGNEVNILLKRDGKEKNVKVTIDEDKIIGIMIVTNYNYDTGDDLDIAFRSGEGGSSGGLVLALGIYSKITGIDLLKGRHIAGTGTIDIDGNVGEIDGVKYKVAGAVKKHMDIILVSQYNYDEAKKVIEENNYDIELVKVDTFKEAIDYLTQ